MREKLVADINEQIRLVNLFVNQIKHHEKQIKLLDQNAKKDEDNIDLLTARETKFKELLTALEVENAKLESELEEIPALHILKRAKLKQLLKLNQTKIELKKAKIFEYDTAIAQLVSKVEHYHAKTRPILIENYKYHLTQLARSVQKHNILIDEFNFRFQTNHEHLSLQGHFEKGGELTTITQMDKIPNFEGELA